MDNEPTKRGYKQIINCSSDVDGIKITVLKKKRWFQKQERDSIYLKKGIYTVQITIEDIM